MRARLAACLGLGAFALACNTPGYGPEARIDDSEPQGRRVQTGESYRLPGAGVQLQPPAGWVERAGRDEVVYARAIKGKGRNTIAVRAVPVEPAATAPHGWTERRTREVVIPATEEAIRYLPEARILSKREVTVAGLPGESLDVTFAPPGKGGARYAREHVVLVGKSRVFHVMHTGRVGSLAATKSEFQAVVASLKEEV